MTSRCAAMIVSMAARNGSGREPGGGGSGSTGRTSRNTVVPVMSSIADMPVVTDSTRRADRSVAMTLGVPDRLAPKLRWQVQ